MFKNLNFDEWLMIVLFVLVLVLVLWGARYGYSIEEKNECLQWQKEARFLPDYYLVGWQKEQCDRYGIQIDAPIK
jgi:hypothetical protein